MAVSSWTCTQHHTWKSTSLLFSPLFLFLVSFSSPSLLFPASLPHLLVSGLHLHSFREAQPHPESHQLLRQLPQRQPHKAETSARHHLEVDPRLHFHSHHGRGGLDGLCRRDPHLAPPRLTVVPAKVTSYAYMCHSVRAYSCITSHDLFQCEEGCHVQSTTFQSFQIYCQDDHQHGTTRTRDPPRCGCFARRPGRAWQRLSTR